jgi:hypothetical protein
LQWLQELRDVNGENLDNVRCEASRYFESKKERGCVKYKSNKLATNSKNKNI